MNQEWLIRFVEHRIGDRRIIRLIRKWLKAGVMEDGVVTVSDRGTGQGAVFAAPGQHLAVTIPPPAPGAGSLPLEDSSVKVGGSLNAARI